MTKLAKTLAYYEICPFFVHYESKMFYSTGPSNIWPLGMVRAQQLTETEEKNTSSLGGTEMEGTKN
jgi:hypothetical protein